MTSTRYPPGPSDWTCGIRLAGRIRQDSLGFFTRAARDYGDVVYMRLGPYRDYTLNHPELVREVLVTKSKHFHKMALQKRVLRQWNGDSVLLTEDEQWLRQRRLVQPAFASKRLETYVPAMLACTNKHLQGWQPAADFEIGAAMTDLSLAIIGRTMFDADLTGNSRAIGQAVAILSEIALEEMTTAFSWPDWFPLEIKRKKKWAMRVLDDAIRGFIGERRQSNDDRGDLLSMLLLAVDDEGDGSKLSDQQARNEAMTLLLAGHDTTAAALTWTFYLLAKHPDVEQKVFEEIERVLQGRAPAAADLPRLKLVECVLKESMRLYPPAVGVFAREAVDNVEIGGWSIARGSIVRILSWVLHRDARWFPNPENFDPDRFAPGLVEQQTPYSYIPFGAGPRACIGMAFAMLEMTLIVAATLQRYRLQLAPGQGEAQLLPQMSLRPKGGIRMRAERRPQHSVTGVPA